MDEQRAEIKELESLVQQMETERNRYKDEWSDLSAHIAPECGVFSFSESEANRGRTDRSKILDGHPCRVARDFAAGMQSVATPKSRPWFRTGTQDIDLMEFQPVKSWLKIVDDVLQFIFNQSNLYTVLPTSYLELGVFGVSAIAVLDSFSSVLRFRPFTIGEFMLARNHEGVADVMARKYHMTAREMVMAFGQGRVSQQVLAAFNGSKPLTQFPVTHVVRPNMSPGKRTPFSKDKAFNSIYYEPGVKSTLLESGFDYFPFLVPASNRIGTRVYGSGLGQVALPDVKSLYKLKAKLFLGVDKMVDPPLASSGTAKASLINSMPGGISFDQDIQGGGQGLRALYEVRPDLASGNAMVQDLRDQIRSAFYNDLFLMLAKSDRREITAREVAERHEEKLLMLAPLSEAIHSEMLDPLIDIAFAKAMEHGLIPPPPQELRGQDLKVEYIDLLTQAQKMVGLTASEQLAGFVGNISAIFPEVRHKYNVFEAVDDYASRLGTVPAIIRPDDEANKLIDAERQQAAQQQAMEQASLAADSAKVMSETDVGGGSNALQALVGGMSQ